MTAALPHICVCICTFKRLSYLGRLLQELANQRTENRFTYSIVVADNDDLQSAKPVVLAFAKTSPIAIKYCVEPRQNIALARNKAMERVEGDFVAWIDDDEYPAPDWLVRLFLTCCDTGADGVLGPVKPYFPESPPNWLIRARLCERPSHKTGTVIDWREARTGNLLLRRRLFDGVTEPFRREFGNGSEDTDFFRRMNEADRRFVWCDEAVVFEAVPPQRCKASYFLKRALLRGQNQKHLATAGSVAKSALAVPIYTFLLPFLALRGRGFLMTYLVKLFGHIGNLLAAVGLKPMGDKYLIV